LNDYYIIMSDNQSGVSFNYIVGLVISFLLIALLLPVGLDALLSMVLPEGIDESIETLLMVVLPLMAVLGVVIAFLPKFKNN